MTNFDVGNSCLVDTRYEVGTTCLVSNQETMLLAVCQVLRDISCVNPSRTPKAFKGKGSAVNQGVNSSLLVLAGAGA